MNCTKYLCKTGYSFFFFSDYWNFEQVLLLVARLLTQLTFCVSALCMFSALYYCCFILLFFGGFIWNCPDQQVCVQSQRLFPPTLSGLLYSLWKGLMSEETLGGREILDYFGGLALGCITKVSGVQSVIAECSLYICVHSILQEKKQ